MNNLKNLAGNDCAIFLFRFELQPGNAISFVINQEIYMDMYEDLNDEIKPLAHACCETLARYRHQSVSTTIMDYNILDTGELEVMLSKGLGKYFPEDEKQQLFNDAHKIAKLLITVMDKRDEELKEGKHQDPFYKDFSTNPDKVKKGLEELAQAKRNRAELKWLLEGKRVRPGIKQLRPEDLPPGVKAVRGYDHRGHCLIFEHETLGELGRIVLVKLAEKQMLVQAYLNMGQEDMKFPLVQKKKKVFGKIVATVNKCFDENFPD